MCACFSMQLTEHPAQKMVAAQNAARRDAIPAGFFPYDARIPLGDASGRRESPSPFFGEKKDGKKPLADGHVFIPGVI